MKLFKNKKGNLNLLILGPVFIIVSGLIASMLASTMANVQATLPQVTTAQNTTYNMATQTLTGVTSVSSQYGTIGLIIVAAIIIGMIFTYILSRFMREDNGIA
jgi:hypothetical protein